MLFCVSFSVLDAECVLCVTKVPFKRLASVRFILQESIKLIKSDSKDVFVTKVFFGTSDVSNNTKIKCISFHTNIQQLNSALIIIIIILFKQHINDF